MNPNPLRRHSDAVPPTSAQRITFGQWLARLSEECLPRAYVAGRMDTLEGLYDDGATPREAAVYCRAYLLAPRVESVPAWVEWSLATLCENGA